MSRLFDANRLILLLAAVTVMFRLATGFVTPRPQSSLLRSSSVGQVRNVDYPTSKFREVPARMPFSPLFRFRLGLYFLTTVPMTRWSVIDHIT